MLDPPFPVPAEELERLEVLHSLQVLDTPPEECYDRITELAARLFDVPIVLVSLVDSSRQWWKSQVGLEGVKGTPRNLAFCAHAIMPDAPDIFLVKNALEDDRFRLSPLVTGPPDIRFYAGVPLMMEGVKIGTFCIIDNIPREDFSVQDRIQLMDLAAMVVDELKIRVKTKRQQLSYITTTAHDLQIPLKSLEVCLGTVRRHENQRTCSPTKAAARDSVGALLERAEAARGLVEWTVQRSLALTRIQHHLPGTGSEGSGSAQVEVELVDLGEVVATAVRMVQVVPKRVPITTSGPIASSRMPSAGTSATTAAATGMTTTTVPATGVGVGSSSGMDQEKEVGSGSAEVEGEEGGVSVYTNRATILHCLLDFLTNACRYTAEGSIDIRVVEKKEGGGGGGGGGREEDKNWIRMFRLQVTDTSTVEVPKDIRDRMFKVPFVHDSGSSATGQYGMGLGLFSVSANIRHVGGGCGYHPASHELAGGGPGSCFYIDFPDLCPGGAAREVLSRFEERPTKLQKCHPEVPPQVVDDCETRVEAAMTAAAAAAAAAAAVGCRQDAADAAQEGGGRASGRSDSDNRTFTRQQSADDSDGNNEQQQPTRPPSGARVSYVSADGCYVPPVTSVDCSECTSDDDTDRIGAITVDPELSRLEFFRDPDGSGPASKGPALGSSSKKGSAGGAAGKELVVPTAAEELGLQGIRVLLCDDSSTTRRLMTRVLEGGGFEVDQSAHGREALEILKKGQHRFCFMDLILERMSGIEVVRALREWEEDQEDYAYDLAVEEHRASLMEERESLSRKMAGELETSQGSVSAERGPGGGRRSLAAPSPLGGDDDADGRLDEEEEEEEEEAEAEEGGVEYDEEEDEKMCEESGVRAAKEARKSKVCVLGYSCSASPADVLECASCGMNGFMQKPFIPREVFGHMKLALLNYRQQEDLYEKEGVGF